MSENETEKKPTCPLCGGSDVEEQEMAENSFGDLQMTYLCKKCDIEFESKKA